MRLSCLLLLAACSCAGGRLEYGDCTAEEAGQIRCGLGCAAGGVGCSELQEVAVQCSTTGQSHWAAIGECGQCADLSADANAVTCAHAAPVSLLGAACESGDACTPDGRTALHCRDGEYRFVADCAANQTCGKSGSSVGCL